MRERGAAIITALLVVMLASTIAAYLLAQQSHALTRTARANELGQALRLARPVIDYARAVLFDVVKPGKRVDFGQTWAQGLNAIPIDGAIASGVIRDEAGLFNINNLVKDGIRSERDIELFARLLTQLKLDPSLAVVAADWIDTDDEPTGASGMENATYFGLSQPVRAPNRPLLQLEELAHARGFDADVLQRLAPFVTALRPLSTAQARTKINLNTAPEEVLRALFPELGGEAMAMLLRTRQTNPFDQIEGANGAKERFATVPPAIWELVGTQSAWFRATVAINNGGASVRQTALLHRAADAADRWPSIIWVRTE